MKKYVILFFILHSFNAFSTLKIVTTLSDLADITKQIGGDKVQVDFIARGNQNPHFVEVKPSYMIKLKSADIFYMIGMDLEMWAQQIIDGSRNDKLDVIDLSKSINKLEVPQRIDASQGDVHRFGNPHYWLDPRNIKTIADEIVSSLAKHDPSNEDYYKSNAYAYLKKLDSKISQWESMMKPFAGKKIITFHKSWSYFASWSGLVVADYIEPKPGIQPSPSHTAELITLIRDGNIKAIIVEPFYDDSAPQQIARSANTKVIRLCTSVGGVDQAHDYISMMEYNVRTLTDALK